MANGNKRLSPREFGKVDRTQVAKVLDGCKEERLVVEDNYLVSHIFQEG